MIGHTASSMVSLSWLLGAGLLSVRLARRHGIPDLVLFMALGVVLGPQMLDLVRLPATSDVGELIVMGGAVFMLYEGGRAIDLDVLRRIWLGTALLATLGVVITAATLAAAVHYFIGATWPIALLSAAAIASTDPATIVPLLSQVKVKRRVQQLVISEAAFNDATGAVLTMAVLVVLQGGEVTPGALGGVFLRLIMVGLLAGVTVGIVVQTAVVGGQGFQGNGAAREENGVASLLAMLAAYTTAAALGGSGFMAVFAAGVVRGNGARWGIDVHPDDRDSHDTFLSFLGTAMRIFVFGVLGANVNLVLLEHLGVAGGLVMVVLLVVARPITVFVCLRLDRPAKWSIRELLFVSWIRETGVVPAALANLLLAARAPGADEVAAIIFLAVLVTILIQGPSTALWARRTGVGM